MPCNSKQVKRLLVTLSIFISTLCGALSVPLNPVPTKQRILLIRTDAGDEVKSALDQTGHFSEVAAYEADQGTPDLRLLADYDAVLVWSSWLRFHDSIALGDVLADYWDAGGRVVLAQYSMTNASRTEPSGPISVLVPLPLGTTMPEPPVGGV